MSLHKVAKRLCNKVADICLVNRIYRDCFRPSTFCVNMMADSTPGNVSKFLGVQFRTSDLAMEPLSHYRRGMNSFSFVPVTLYRFLSVSIEFLTTILLRLSKPCLSEALFHMR
ncbi:unnamed protein product [Chondrus crispus]|uniref:Uncharacterized protein n=1 Tax=Chondrus crispus TaxID=2769 RepID=R7QLI0_CHOCR|nr:unnamed protein product [Chondrus crispus]CDF39357.1 unnamed protein product [Chondrus crispus]|eukprot:XP_005719268.1 unnamed protein product [Chondrus crispus]